MTTHSNHNVKEQEIKIKMAFSHRNKKNNCLLSNSWVEEETQTAITKFSGKKKNDKKPLPITIYGIYSKKNWRI